MNLDDESLLSAYLDDELDPSERLVVEWSVESGPALADQLRSLAFARDAVAGLSRPSIPVDLATVVASRLAADRLRSRLLALARPGRVAVAVAGLSGMAASLLYALFLLHRSMHDTPEGPAVVSTPPPSRPGPLLAGPSMRPEPEPAMRRDRHAPIPILPASVAAISPAVARGAEAREDEDRLRVTRMLERSDVRLVLITTDVIEAADRIQDLIHNDPRKSPDFGRITIRAGIVVDPARPDSAEVFVVPVAEGGRRSFLDKLRAEFRDLEEGGDPRPDLVTQLTEVGHVALLQGMHASPLVEPPAELTPFIAKQGGEPKADVFHPARIVSTEGLPEVPGPFGPRPAPPALAEVDLPRAQAGLMRALVGPPDPRPGPGEVVTLLVWVTRPPRR